MTVPGIITVETVCVTVNPMAELPYEAGFGSEISGQESGTGVRAMRRIDRRSPLRAERWMQNNHISKVMWALNRLEQGSYGNVSCQWRYDMPERPVFVLTGADQRAGDRSIHRNQRRPSGRKWQQRWQAIGHALPESCWAQWQILTDVAGKCTGTATAVHESGHQNNSPMTTAFILSMFP